jgi:hypothetical protein
MASANYGRPLRYHPPLLGNSSPSSPRSLSKELQAVHEHNPTKFLGTLRAYWGEYAKTATLLDDELRECEVLCRSGSSLPLYTTYLPTPKILSKISELGIPENKIPMLYLPEALVDQPTYRTWKFLKDDCGVESETDMDFYMLTILAMSFVSSVPDLDKVSVVYQNMTRMATVEHQDDLRCVSSPPLLNISVNIRIDFALERLQTSGREAPGQVESLHFRGTWLHRSQESVGAIVWQRPLAA